MDLPWPLSSLLESRAYTHPCTEIKLVETHISWVILTGRFAYKLKKPVTYSFVDFGTLARREHFCREELRCNRAFSPDLYLDVVPVTAGPGGAGVMNGDGEVVEWAVKMRQFDPGQALDRLLAREQLNASLLVDFGARLAQLHAALPRLQGTADDVDRRLLHPVQDNFREIAKTGLYTDHRELLDEALARARLLARRLHPVMESRIENGMVRECHGDLHLSNLVLENGVVTAFDCLEFNPNLRWIDTISDIAFLFMDCLVRGHADQAYPFVDSYLEHSGDYAGARLLAFFAAYRSIVRAKVAALRWEQQPDPEIRERFHRHLEWGSQWLNRKPGRLLLMCGLSGSGKSHLAGRLVAVLPALRLRSDVVRKNLAGLTPAARSGSAPDSGIYDPSHTERVFEQLARLSEALLETGEHVIVDATFISRARRQEFLDLAARLDVDCKIVYCSAPGSTLRERILKREQAGTDASEATLEVLRLQTERIEIPAPPEPVIRVDTSRPMSAGQLGALAEKICARAPSGYSTPTH